MRHVVVGGGVIGEVIVAACVGAGDEVFLVETNPDRAKEVAKKHSIETSTLAQAIGSSPDKTASPQNGLGSTVIWLAVKPQQLPDVLPELDGLIGDTQDLPLVISLAAGTNTEQLAKLAPHLRRLVRVMPNTPARIGRGITAIATPTPTPTTDTPNVSRADIEPVQSVDDVESVPTSADIELVRSLLAPLGAVVEVPEALIDAVTVIAGSGPAYLFYLAEAMAQAGVSLGLEPALSEHLVRETLAGASEMLRTSGLPAQQLRSEVTSRAGVTQAATSYLDAHRINAEIIAAIEAAHQRAKELGKDTTTG